MVFKPGQSGNPSGMKKGTKTKQYAIKMAFFKAFEEMGGLKTLVAYAKKDKKEFYRILSSMLPKDIDVDLNARVALFEEFEGKSAKDIKQEVVEMKKDE